MQRIGRKSEYAIHYMEPEVALIENPGDFPRLLA
jgi:hypothetical protein